MGLLAVEFNSHRAPNFNLVLVSEDGTMESTKYNEQLKMRFLTCTSFGQFEFRKREKLQETPLNSYKGISDPTFIVNVIIMDLTVSPLQLKYLNIHFIHCVNIYYILVKMISLIVTKKLKRIYRSYYWRFTCW